MVNTAGVVTRRTGVFPQLQQVKFDCLKCGYVLGPFFQNSEGEVKPNTCPQCQAKGPFAVRLSSLPAGVRMPYSTSFHTTLHKHTLTERDIAALA